MRKIFNLFAGPQSVVRDPRSRACRSTRRCRWSPLPGTVGASGVGRLHLDLLGHRGSPGHRSIRRPAGRRLFTLGFIHPPGTARIAPRVRRGGHRARPHLADDLLPADDLRRVQPPRGAGRDARGPRRPSAQPGPAADALLPESASLDQIDEDLFEHWEIVVHRGRREPHQPAVADASSVHRTRERSWITAAGCVLDTAAIVSSTHRSAVQRQCDVVIRTGFLCLRRIADLFQLSYDPGSAPTDPITISRDEFDACAPNCRPSAFR